MVAVGRVGWPVRVGIVRRYDFDQAAGSRDAVKFAHKRHHIRNVFDDVPTNNFVKLIVGKRIGNVSEIVKYVGVCSWIRVDPNRARILVLSAAHVENLRRELR